MKPIDRDRLKKDMMTLLKQQKPIVNPSTQTRRRSFGLPSASTQMVRSTTPVFGGRTFRRRLPKLI
jgi:hypothetical protein